jgi:hypothetical protein
MAAEPDDLTTADHLALAAICLEAAQAELDAAQAPDTSNTPDAAEPEVTVTPGEVGVSGSREFPLSALSRSGFPAGSGGARSMAAFRRAAGR